MILKKIYITVHTPGIVVSVFCQSVLLVMVIIVRVVNQIPDDNKNPLNESKAVKSNALIFLF